MTDEQLDQLEKLASEVVTQGEWEWGFIEAKSDEDHVEDFAYSLAETRKHFNIEGDVKLHCVTVPGEDTKLCLTGSSPTSEKRAQFIATMSPQNVLAMCRAIRAANAIINA